MPYFALFDDAVSGRAKLYQNHVESRLFHHNELDSLNDTLQKGWRKGLHAVLFADYEFGLPLMDISSARSGNLCLHWFADCSEIDAESWLTNHSDGLKVALDIPTGLNCDTAEADPDTFRADLTYTFAAYKPAHLSESGKTYCQETVCLPIGID